MKSALLVCVLGLAVAVMSGCCTMPCGPCGPCGPGDACGPGPDCVGGCGPCGGPLGWRLFPWRRGAPPCGPADCDPCSEWECGECDAGCARPCFPGGPLGLLVRLFRCEVYSCGGCGERYWGEYISNPPDRCDPCDCHGNYTGRCGGGSGPWFAGASGYGDGNFAGQGGMTAAAYAGGPPAVGSRVMAGPPASYSGPVAPSARSYAGGTMPAGIAPSGPSGGYNTVRPPVAANTAERYAGARYPMRQYPTGAYGGDMGRSMPGAPRDGYLRPYPPARYSRGGYPESALPQANSMSGSPYAPRIISETDQVVEPAISGDPVMQSARPRAMPVQR